MSCFNQKMQQWWKSTRLPKIHMGTFFAWMLKFGLTTTLNSAKKLFSISVTGRKKTQVK
jgi:hypothetical protein